MDRIKHLEQEVEKAKERAEYAASIALAGIETTKHFMRTVEAQHEALGEVISATKKMVSLNEHLARHALAEDVVVVDSAERIRQLEAEVALLRARLDAGREVPHDS